MMRCTRWQAKKDLCKVAQHPLAVWGFKRVYFASQICGDH